MQHNQPQHRREREKRQPKSSFQEPVVANFPKPDYMAAMEDDAKWAAQMQQKKQQQTQPPQQQGNMACMYYVACWLLLARYFRS